MKEWFVWEKVRRIYPMQIIDVLDFMANFPEPAVPMASGVKFENRDAELISIKDQVKEAGKKATEAAIKDPVWMMSYLDQIDTSAAAYFETAKKVLGTDLKEKSKEELAEIFTEFYASYSKSHNAGMFAHAMEYFGQFVSKKVKEILERKIKEKKLDLNYAKTFAILSQPEKESSLSLEKKDFLKLLDKLHENRDLVSFFESKTLTEIEKALPKEFPEFNSLLEGHWKKFIWIFFMYEGPPLKKRYFIEQLKQNLKGGMYIAKEFEENKKIIGLQEKLLERLSDNESEKKILSFPKRLIETKGHRKDAMYFGCFSLTKLFTEIAKRLEISINQVRFMTKQELLDALDGEFKDFELLNERFKYSVFYSVNGKRTFLVGAEARKWYKENVEAVKISETNELTGTPVFDGLVTGKVKVINHPNEIIKMEKGDILVSHATNPNLLPAMAKAGAIVTDLGGLTCHAAIVSREFRIPCVIGTNIATQVLKDNDVVEVDAKKGIIKKKKN